MTSNKREYWLVLGERLAEERNRCGHTQQSVADRFDITARTQIKYELGETGPDAYYLRGIGEIGLDVPYLLTGRRSVLHMSDEEGDLIAVYRRIDVEVRTTLVDLLRSVERISGKTPRKRSAPTDDDEAG
jgi:transcriptional regulator with XRE-family HTH domain